MLPLLPSAPSLCPRLSVLAQARALVIGRAPGVHCVYANQSPGSPGLPYRAGAAAAAALRWALLSSPEPGTVMPPPRGGPLSPGAAI